MAGPSTPRSGRRCAPNCAIGRMQSPTPVTSVRPTRRRSKDRSSPSAIRWACCGCCAATAAEYLPGGRCSSVCDVRSIAVPVNAPATLVESGAAANHSSFPIPLVAAG
ncbi:hypothetical protein G6F31_020136 [Rhizopus arrhizus]|nr:hypothetical protein G6F31_020136 [Rhizopus arrhizus]